MLLFRFARAQRALVDEKDCFAEEHQQTDNAAVDHTIYLAESRIQVSDPDVSMFSNSVFAMLPTSADAIAGGLIGTGIESASRGKSNIFFINRYPQLLMFTSKIWS